jgi:hypothetical protein
MSRESLTRFIENLYEEIHKSAEYRRHTANLRTHHFIWSKTDFQVRISKDLQARGLILTAADNTKISKECDILSNEIISAIQNIRSERDSLAEKLELSAGKIDYAFTSMTNTGRKPTRWASADDVFANLKEVYKEAIGIFFNNMQTYFQSMQESPEETALRVANREGNTKGKSSKRGIRTKGKGKLIKTAGRFINAEHEDNAGILESLIRDAFKKTSAEVVDSQGNSISEAQLQKDLKALGIKIQMRRDENDNHVITLGGSLINIQKGNQAKEVNADLKKALERAHAHLAKNMGGLQHLEGSDTPLQKRKKRLTATAIEPFKKKKNVNIKVTHEDIKVNKAKGSKVTTQKKIKATKARAKNAKLVSAAVVMKTTKRGKRRPTKKSPLQDMLKLVVQFNSKLPQTVRRNMGTPKLNNITGRFANSAQVANVQLTPQGFPSVGYTYQKEPYQVFEDGVGAEPWANGQRDPRELIDKSIREIAAELAIGRIYTRRV